MRDADDLYFFRLALLHEDMHHEAALYRAQSLGLAINDPWWQATSLSDERHTLTFAASLWTLGSATDGFAFDNELPAHTAALPATEIGSRVVHWAEYLPCLEGAAPPRYLRRQGSDWQRLAAIGSDWQRWRHGQWTPLDLSLPACHLRAAEAEAWCCWAGRRLPSEAEWERAAVERPGQFAWGQVWEWTASPFEPYLGFTPHPYRDYSAPWFGGSRRVLRGASFMTQPHLHDPRYRNFFPPGRSDVAAGFRSCAR